MTPREPVVVAVLGVAIGLAWVTSTSARTLEADTRCSTVRECRQAIDWWKAQTRKAKLERYRVTYPSLRQAAVIAGRVFHVDPWAMLRVARCESTSTGEERWVSARNASSATGAWQWLDSTWRHSPWAGFDRRNVYVQALATAQLVSQDGWRQWTCQP